MSYIRFGQTGDWEDIEGLYVYSDKHGQLHGAPRTEEGFVEVAMRMLDQSNELSEETLEEVHSAFQERLGMDNE